MDKINFPFGQNKVPVIYSVQELLRFLADHASFMFCFYLADKDDSAWEVSTSRVYMNQVLPHVIYLPVNIQKDDLETLRLVYEIAEKTKQVVAINQSQPHKSNAVLAELFVGEAMPANVDAIVKDEHGRLVPYDLHGDSFVQWFTEEISLLHNQRVLIMGVGGVGEPIARRIVLDAPKELLLIDPIDKRQLQVQLASLGEVKYLTDLEQVSWPGDLADFVAINAAGASSESNSVEGLLERFKFRNFIFVDLRSQLRVAIVDTANRLGWRGYTGYGMNVRNDYSLLGKIAQVTHKPLLSYVKFKELVAGSS